MNGSKNRPSFVKILLFFLTCEQFIFRPEAYDIESSKSLLDTSRQENSNGDVSGMSNIYNQDTSPKEQSRGSYNSQGPNDSSVAEMSDTLSFEKFMSGPASAIEQSHSMIPRSVPPGKEASPLKELSKGQHRSISGPQESSVQLKYPNYFPKSGSVSPKSKKHPSHSESSPSSERSRSRSSSKSGSRSRSKSRSRSGSGSKPKASREERSVSRAERSRSRSRREASRREVSVPRQQHFSEPASRTEIEPSYSQNIERTIPLTAPDLSASPQPVYPYAKSEDSVFALEESTLLEKQAPQETSVSSPESSSLISEEQSPRIDWSVSPSQMPSRKSAGPSEFSPPVRPYSPVDEGGEFSALLDDSLSSNDQVEATRLPLEVASESTIASNYMTLLSSLYGTQALSGVPLEFSEELFKIETTLSETLYSSGLSISGADMTLFTKRVITEESSPDRSTSFAEKLDPNSFEKIPSFQKAAFNFLECVYQLENILFHIRSFIKPVPMSHILRGCNNIRSSLGMQSSIAEKKEILSKAVQYLILRIYNIRNDEIVDIIAQRSSIPAILDKTAFERLKNSLTEDFLSNVDSLPLTIEFWRTIFLQQLQTFGFLPKDPAEDLLDDEFGLMDILLDAVYSDPIRMCPYVTAVVFFKVQPFRIEEIGVSSAKIQTFCLIYLRNMGLDELATLDKFEMPSLSRNPRLDKITGQLAPGFGILPYFHPSFPKDGKTLTWETCYSIYSSVSLMLNSLKSDLMFPQISPLCAKITNKPPSPKFILGMFSRLLDIPSSIQNDLLEIQGVDPLIASLSDKIKIPESYLREIYTDYIQGNPIKYLNSIYTIFSKSVKLYSGVSSAEESKHLSKTTNMMLEQLYLTRNVSEGTRMFQRLHNWSSSHLYFLSFTMGVPNSSEILGGVYSFTPSNCESLLFSFFRRVSYSTRSSIVDSLTLCITMYSVIHKGHVSPVLVKNSSLEDLKDALNYKIGTWAPTQNEWMRAIYMVFETRMEIIPNISNIQTISFAINEDFFNCFYSVNKYLHGMVIVGSRHKVSGSPIEDRILKERHLGFSLCSLMSIGAHSTKEEAIELRIISTVIESVRQFGFKTDVEQIKEFIKHHKESSGPAFPSGNVIMEHVVSKFPTSLKAVIKKAFLSNQPSSGLPPYFVLTEGIILGSLESRGCSIKSREVGTGENSLELHGDASYYNTINACLSWKTFGYFNLVSCYSVLVSSGACESKETLLEALVEVAERLEWPRELILLNLSQDFSFSDSQVFLGIKQSVDPTEFEKYTQIAQSLIINVEGHANGFSWSEKSLSNPESVSPMLAESSLEISRSQAGETNYSFAFGLVKDSVVDYATLWEYRRDIVLKQIHSFPVDSSLRLSEEELSSLLVGHPSQSIHKFLRLNMTPFVNQLKEMCYKEPHGAFLCEISPRLGLPPLRVLGSESDAVLSTSISMMTPPAGHSEDKGVKISVETPSGSSAGWEELKPQSLLFLTVLLGPNWREEHLRYRKLSAMYFPYSGEYIRLSPPVFKVEIKETAVSSSSLLESSLSASSSPAKISSVSELPGIWHEHLGNISIHKLVEFSKFVPNNHNLLLNIIWTLASAFNSLWAGGVELCSTDLSSIYVYTGSQSQQSLNTARTLDEFLEFGPNEENVHSLTNFVLHTVSPPLIRFGELGRSKFRPEAESSESSRSAPLSECNDRRNLVRVLKEIVGSSSELSAKITGEDLEKLCREISELDSSKLDCGSLAWVDPQRAGRLPNDLEKWPVTDVLAVPPALRQESVEAPVTVIPEVFSEEGGSRSAQEDSVPRDYSMYSAPASIPAPASAPVSVPAPASAPVSVPAPKPSAVEEESHKSEISPVSTISEEESEPEHKPERTSSNDIFDQQSVKQEDSQAFGVAPLVGRPYGPESLGEFTLARVPKGQLLDLQHFPKVQGTLPEKRAFEIRELLTAFQGVVEDVVTRFTSWSASVTGRHSSKVPDTSYRPLFIFAPPTPNNRADSPRILEKEFHIRESVFLFAREELQRMELPLQRLGDEDLVEVLISRAGLSYVQAGAGETSARFPDIKPEISQVYPASAGAIRSEDRTSRADSVFERSRKEGTESQALSQEMSWKSSERSSSPGGKSDSSSGSATSSTQDESPRESRQDPEVASSMHNDNMAHLSPYGFETDSSASASKSDISKKLN